MINIVKAAPHDLPAILEIERLSFDHPWSPALFEQSQANIWIAKEADKICGFIIFEAIADEVHIIHMAVSPEHRRKGIAKEMLKKALSQPAQKYFLEVREENQPARKLYESFGFKVIDRRKNYYEDGADALVMQFTPGL